MLSEIILSLSIFAILSSSIVSLVLGGGNSLIRNEKQIGASALAQEAVENIRSEKETAWNEFYFKASSSEQIGDFTRNVSFLPVCKDGSGNIVDCPGVYTDVHEKIVNTSVAWPFSSLDQKTLFSNWDSLNWKQTDWSGGQYQEQNNIKTSDVGEIKLINNANISPANWIFVGGSQFFDDNDFDFASGTLNNTQIIGTGSAAKIVLAKNYYFWQKNKDSNLLTNQNIVNFDFVATNTAWAIASTSLVLRYDGFNWATTTSFSNTSTLKNIKFFSDNNGYVVGNAGKFFKYSSSSWASVNTATSTNINSLDGVSSSSLWLVGDGGRIWSYNGLNLLSTSSPTTQNLNSIFMLSSSSGWAVGASGTILRFSTSTWSNYGTVGTSTLRDVFMLSATSGWAVGDNGKILRFATSTWSSFANLGTSSLNSVFFSGENSGWAVSASGTIYKYNGSAWSQESAWVNNNFSSIDGVFPNKLFIAGASGAIMEYANAYSATGTFVSRIFNSGVNNNAWSSLSWGENLATGTDVNIMTRTSNNLTIWSAWSSALTNNITSVFTSPNNRYAQYMVNFSTASSSLTSEFLNLHLYYNTSLLSNLNDVSYVGSSSVWAVGNNSQILHYDGSQWAVSFNAGGANRIMSIDMLSDSDGWAAGQSGKIYHYNGLSWSEFLDTGNQTWQILRMSSVSDGWVAGNAGFIYRFNGTNWSLNTDIGNANLFDLFILSSTSSWAVGQNGSIFNFNGNSWNQVTSTNNSILNGVYFLNNNDGWVVGNGGTIEHWDGTAWSNVLSPVNTKLTDIYMLNTDNGWAVGSNGVVLQWNGINWTQNISNTTCNLTGIDGSMAVCNGGSIVADFISGESPVQGYLISLPFNLGSSSPLQVIEWSQYLPTSCLACSVKMQLRVGDDSTNWTPWSGEFTQNKGEIVPPDLNWRTWAQYKIILNGDGVYTPIVYDTKINYK